MTDEAPMTLDQAITLISDCAEQSIDALRVKWEELDKAALKASAARAEQLRLEQDAVSDAKLRIAKEAAAAIMQLPAIAQALKGMQELVDELKAVGDAHAALTSALKTGASYLGKAADLVTDIRKLSGSKD